MKKMNKAQRTKAVLLSGDLLFGPAIKDRPVPHKAQAKNKSPSPGSDRKLQAYDH
jgi:hypothetical protein